MRNSAYNGVKIFTCNANIELANKISDELKKLSETESTEFVYAGMGASETSFFANGEIRVEINETVRGADVYIVQPTCAPVNDNLMALLIMIDAMRRASAGRVTAVIPFFAYARQDRKARSRDPISAKLVADIITTAGADRVLSMDLHCDQIQGFFDIPVDHLRGMPLFYRYYKEKFTDLSDVVVVSPDLGSVSRARMLAGKLNIPLAVVDKRRSAPGKSEVMNVIGDIKDKTVIILDDMIDTGDSVVKAARSLAELGAKEVYVCATHALFSKDAVNLIKDSVIKEMVVLDTIPLAENKRIDKIKVISVAEVFADAIYRIHSCLSVSKLFT